MPFPGYRRVTRLAPLSVCLSVCLSVRLAQNQNQSKNGLTSTSWVNKG